MRYVRSTSVAALIGAAAAMALLATTVDAQKAAEIAAKFNGTWKINRELSPAVGGAHGAGGTPLYEIGFFAAYQGRGGGGRGGGGEAGGPAAGGQSPTERAGQAALKSLQQFGETVTITATPDSIAFKDARGERVYAMTDKNVKVDVGDGAILTSRSKWEKDGLKQVFTFGETSITQTWEMSDSGTRINFKMLILNMSHPEIPTEAKVVYDKQ